MYPLVHALSRRGAGLGKASESPTGGRAFLGETLDELDFLRGT